MARFVHFVVDDLYENGNIERVRDAFLLMERLAAADDQDTRDLIGFGFFETLQNVSSWKSYGSKPFGQFLGPVSELLWREIQRMWVGNTSLAMSSEQSERIPNKGIGSIKRHISGVL